jgi:hypothetical protein
MRTRDPQFWRPTAFGAVCPKRHKKYVSIVAITVGRVILNALGL